MGTTMNSVDSDVCSLLLSPTLSANPGLVLLGGDEFLGGGRSGLLYSGEANGIAPFCVVLSEVPPY